MEWKSCCITFLSYRKYGKNLEMMHSQTILYRAVLHTVPVQRVIWLRGHQQPQYTAEDGPDRYTRAVTGGENAVTDAATTIYVAMVYLERRGHIQLNTFHEASHVSTHTKPEMLACH